MFTYKYHALLKSSGKKQKIFFSFYENKYNLYFCGNNN
nr:MAG TPA: hypothetical protein [Caudoviricetes sp.]